MPRTAVPLYLVERERGVSDIFCNFATDGALHLRRLFRRRYARRSLPSFGTYQHKL